MSYSSSILGQYEANLTASGTTDRVATDKDTFLKLLVAQLTHQDPLNPVEDKEFIAQLAQFTQVEELQNLNAGMDQLNASYLAQQATNAAGLIGMQVVAGGDNIYLSGAADFTSEADYPVIYFTMPTASESGYFNVYSTNADGSIGHLVYSDTMGSYSAAMHGYAWPGTDSSGNPLANGTYIVNITAVDADGNNILVNTSSNGIVIGVETQADGNHTLYLNDGRTTNFNDVQMIMVPATSGGSGSGTDEGGEDTDSTLETLKQAAEDAALLAQEAADQAAAAVAAAEEAMANGSAEAAELAAQAEELTKAAEEAATAAAEAQAKYEEAKQAAA